MIQIFLDVQAFAHTFTLAAAGNFRGEFIDMLLRSGWVARIVLVVLLFFSVVSWGIILQKYFHIKALNHYSEKFIRVFQNYGPLQEIVKASQKHKHSPLGRIFFAAYTEMQRYSWADSGSFREPGQLSLMLDGVSRCMRNACMLERNRLERNLIFLATTGGVTPFIGLFGTVWGIMNAFRGIGIHGSANITAVAPGIAEALIATAAGLFAAIPGVIAYNYFQRKIMVFDMELEYFSADVLNYLQRNLLSTPSVSRVSERGPSQ